MCVWGGGGRSWWQWILLIFNLLCICSHDFLHILSNLSQKLENLVTVSALRIFLKKFCRIKGDKRHISAANKSFQNGR